MIPKTLHYVWVGEKEKPALVRSCINSWRKFCPDYEIIEWNNQKLKEIENKYVKEAFLAQKWAFVSDYVRLYALYHYGGVYCDTDLQLTNSIDQFRVNSFFTGFENYKGTISPLTALMGAEQGNPIVKDLLDEYKNLHFITPDGQFDLTTNVVRATRYFINNFSLSPKKCMQDGLLELSSGSVIYPSYYFCTPQLNKQNFAIHHFNGSWLPDYLEKVIFEIRSDLLNLFNFKLSIFRRTRNMHSQTIPIHTFEKIVFKIPVFTHKYVIVMTVRKE